MKRLRCQNSLENRSMLVQTLKSFISYFRSYKSGPSSPNGTRQLSGILRQSATLLFCDCLRYGKLEAAGSSTSTALQLPPRFVMAHHGT